MAKFSLQSEVSVFAIFTQVVPFVWASKIKKRHLFPQVALFD